MEEERAKKLIGRIVKTEREKQGLTQEELSERINLDQSNLSNIENGKNFPSFTTFCALIENLGVEPNVFLAFLEFEKNHKEFIDVEIEQFVKNFSPALKLNLLEILKKIKDV